MTHKIPFTECGAKIVPNEVVQAAGKRIRALEALMGLVRFGSGATRDEMIAACRTVTEADDQLRALQNEAKPE